MDKWKRNYIIAGLCIVAVAAILFVKMWNEDKMRVGIARFLQSLPAPLTAEAERIDVSFFSKSFTITNLKGSYEDPGGKFLFKINEISGSGVNVDGFMEGAGTAELVKVLDIIGLDLSGSAISASVGAYHIEGVSGDFPRLKAEMMRVLPDLARLYADPDFAKNDQALAAFLGKLGLLASAYETVTVKKFSVENYTFRQLIENLNMNCIIEKMQGENYTILEMGPTSLTNVAATLNGAPLLKLSSLGMDGAKLPSFTAFLESFASGPPSAFALQQTLKDQPFALRNLRGKDLVVYDPREKDRVLFSLDNGAFSYSAETVHAMDFAYDGMKVGLDLLGAGDLPEGVRERLSDPLPFTGATQVTVDQVSQGTFNIDCKKIAAQSAPLGEFSLSFAVNNLSSMAIMMGAPGAASLKSFDLTATDTGASDIFFMLEAAEDAEGKTPEAIRADILRQMAGKRETAPGDAFRELLDAVSAFVENPGGSLRVTFAPAEPLPLTAVEHTMMTDPGKLGFSTSFTPGK